MTTILRPIANGDSESNTEKWAVRDFSYVNDVVVAPAAATGGTGFRCEAVDKNDSEIACDWKVPDLAAESGYTTEWFRLWLVDGGTNSGTNAVDLKIGGSWHGQTSAQTGTDSNGWTFYDFSVSHNLESGLADNQIRVVSPDLSNDQEYYVDAAYVEVSKVLIPNARGPLLYVI